MSAIAGMAAIALAATACGAPTSSTTGDSSALPTTGGVPDKPSKAVELTIYDVAGDLQLTQAMIDDFVKNNPDVVSKVTYDTGPAPEMAGKIQAQQQAGRVSIDVVLTGTDGLAAGIEQSLFEPLLPTYADRLSNMNNYLEPAANMQKLAQDQGVLVTYYPSGPLIEYNPAKVANPPKTAQELLDWAKANPGKFGYARPANSGPGRTFLMGLPYILGDKDPMDPENGWDKTWDYLKELAKYQKFYPTGTGPTMQNLANGTWDIIATTTGWDINPRALGTVPDTVKVQQLDNTTFVTDAHYAVVPKGVSEDKISAILLLLNNMLTPEQNAKAFDTGYFYPGPCVKDATLDKAPQESQDIIAKFGRPEYDSMIENTAKAIPLDATTMVKAFDKWDKEVGGDKVKES